MTTLGPWAKGMNNRAADHALPIGTMEDPGAAVRNAVNADFSNAGKPSRRDGFEKVYSGIGCKNGFSTPLGRFFTEETSLKKLNSDNSTTGIFQGLTGQTLAYDYFNGVMYFGDGVRNLKITSADVFQWGITPPSPPVLSGISGTYGAGVYLAACCWVDASGVESGCSTIVSISLDDNSGITFGSLPMIQDPQVVALRIYLSTANGKELYHVADTTSPSYSVAAGRYDEGMTLESQFITPPPPARIIRHYNGRAYVADELGTVWYSEPWAFDRFRLAHSFIQFPERVDIMEPVAGGIFFAHGDTTEFYAGSPEDGFTVIPRFPYGGLYGTAKKIKNSENVSWMSQRGMVVGTPDGQCKNIQEDNVATESGISGTALIREKDGLRQFIASIKQPTTSPIAATSWIDAEIIRRS